MRFEDFVMESKNDPYDMVEMIYNKCYIYIKDYLKEFGKMNDLYPPMLYSGRNNDKSYFINRVRKDRNPKDTSIENHEFADDVFYKYLGFRARSNSIFCTGKYNTAKSYGSNVYAIFPIGQYKFVWSDKVNDLYSDIFEDGEYSVVGMDASDIIDNYINNNDLYDEVLEKLENQWYDDNNIDDFEDEEEAEKDREKYIESNIDRYIEELAYQQAKDLIEEKEDDFELFINHHYEDTNLKKAILSGNEVMLHCVNYVAVEYNTLPFLSIYMSIYRDTRPTPELYKLALQNFNNNKNSFNKGSGKPFDVKKRIPRYID